MARLRSCSIVVLQLDDTHFRIHGSIRFEDGFLPYLHDFSDTVSLVTLDEAVNGQLETVLLRWIEQLAKRERESLKKHSQVAPLPLV